jgi:PAS domain S-box-containing protein
MPLLRKEFFGQLAEPFSGEELFDSVTDMVYFLKNSHGQYLVVNQALVERCGCREKAELIGRTADEVYPPPLGQSYRAQDEQILRTGEPILNHLELQIYPGGATGWCTTSKVPLRARSGQVVGLAGISKDVHATIESGEDYTSLANVLRRINSQYDQPLKIQELAEMAKLSTYQFEQRIKKIFGITAGQFIQKVRMDAAVRRLRDSRDPIAKIALDCGYAEQSSFTRQFKLTVGLSPARYRAHFRS